MKNYIDQEGDNTLDIKIFIGTPQAVEKEISAWLDSEPIEIDRVLQTESQGTEGFGVTITFFYYHERLPRFLTKELTTISLVDHMFKYIEDNYMITEDDLLALLDKKLGKTNN